MGRPFVDSETVRARLEQRLLCAFDADATSAEPVTRQRVIRAILADWFIGYGFTKRREDAN